MSAGITITYNGIPITFGGVRIAWGNGEALILDSDYDTLWKLLPRSATRLERHLLTVTDTDLMRERFLNVSKVKREIEPDNFLFLILTEYGFIEAAKIFTDLRSLLDVAKPMRGKWGTPFAVESMAHLMQYPDAEIWEESIPGIHFPEFQMELGQAGLKLQRLATLRRLVNIVKPVRGRFRRVFHKWDVRQSQWDDSQWDEANWDSESGLNIASMAEFGVTRSDDIFLASLQQDFNDEVALGNPFALSVFEVTNYSAVESTGFRLAEEVDSRLRLAEPAEISSYILTNVTDDGSNGVFEFNPENWAADMAYVFTTCHYFAGEGTDQNYPMVAIGPNDLLCLGSSGPPVGNAIKFANLDGEVFSTTLVAVFNDYVGFSSDTVNPANAGVNLRTYRTQHPLPDWVFIPPIVSIPALGRAQLNLMRAPTVGISKGYNDTSGIVMPKGRKFYVRSNNSQTDPLRYPFTYSPVVGDQGSPEFIMLGNVLYLYKLVGPFAEEVVVGDRLSVINNHLTRSRTWAGVATGYQLVAHSLPFTH